MRGWPFAIVLFAALPACRGPISVARASFANARSNVGANQTDPGPRYFVPNNYAQAALEGFDLVGFEESDLHEAEQTRRAVAVELERNYQRPGHRRWFFYSFDRRYLDFIVARYQPTPQRSPRYIAEHRMRVKRTPDAERSLQIEDTIRQVELGEHGVRPGMGRVQVVAKLGKPSHTLSLGKPGSFDMLYPSLCVRFSNHRVAHVWQRARCAIRP